MSGLDLQERCAAAGFFLPIIFITGHGDIPMSVRAMKAGAMDFLEKPFEEQDLLNAINRAIERDRQAPPKRRTGKDPAMPTPCHPGRMRSSPSSSAACRTNKSPTNSVQRADHQGPPPPDHGEDARRLPGRAHPICRETGHPEGRQVIFAITGYFSPPSPCLPISPFSGSCASSYCTKVPSLLYQSTIDADPLMSLLLRANRRPARGTSSAECVYR